MKQKKPKISILFVCTGNTCRSPMAEFLFKDFIKSKKLNSKFKISSAGVSAIKGDIINPSACAALTKLNVAHNNTRKAKMLTLASIINSDLIITMTKTHALIVGKKAIAYSEFLGRDISDPYGGTLEEYLSTAGAMSEGFEKILDYALKFEKDENTNKEEI